MQLQRVEVEWIDACSNDAHFDVEVATSIKPLARRNMGYLLADGKDKVTLCFGLIEDYHLQNVAVDDTLVIPRGMVLKIHRL